MKIKTILILILGALLALGLTLSYASNVGKPKEIAEKQEDHNKGELSEAEKNIILRALRENATVAEKKRAQDICKKKCKVCYDGVTCDLKCARKSCL
jgi:hypothetical protein